MGKAEVKYREWRFILEDELTQVYVLCEALGDCPIGVQGWHHKTFPTSKTVVDIITESFSEGGESPIFWAQKAPTG